MKRVGTGLLSSLLATIALFSLGLVGISAPGGCGLDYGLGTLFMVLIYGVVSAFGLPLLVWILATGAPGFFGGGRALRIELICAAVAIAAAVLYALLPHANGSLNQCRIEWP